uniref:Uncharacterized protein n=1 Tax=Panagrolaimus sp. ES5 TaxID=591445 RepID=A0AC34G5J5_9BILA
MVGGVASENLELPKELIDVVINTFLRVDELYLKELHFADEMKPFQSSIFQKILRTKLDASSCLEHDPKGKKQLVQTLYVYFKAILNSCLEHDPNGKKQIVQTLYVYFKAILNSQNVANLPQRYYLVAINDRAFLMVYDGKSDAILLMDGHLHDQDGAYIVLSTKSKLREICQHIVDKITPGIQHVKPSEEDFHIKTLFFKDAKLYGQAVGIDGKLMNMNKMIHILKYQHLKVQNLFNGDY